VRHRPVPIAWMGAVMRARRRGIDAAIDGPYQQTLIERDAPSGGCGRQLVLKA
jgi:hypothetical protein